MKIEEGGPVDIEADQLIYERDGQLYHADGRVEVLRGNLSLKADHAQLNMVTKELMAWGNVILREGEDVLECERLEINVDTRQGKIYQARLFLKDQNFHITGREIEKLGENHYRLRDGSFTTCDAERPPWKFTVKELEVSVARYGIAKGSVFYIEEIPVLYFPWASYPMRQERQTGLLLPRVGYSKKYGPELKTAFYWAMAKDMDSTLYADWLGKRGFKEGLEYRYAFTRDTEGKANFYFTDDHVFDGKRYALFMQHQQKFSYDIYLKENVNIVSDTRYTRDFDEDLPEGARLDSRSTRQLRSNLFGGKNWDRYSLLADAAAFNDLTKENNEQTIQKLPRIRFDAHPQPLLRTPFFYDFGSSYTDFWREKGAEAHRWDFLPGISYPMRLFNALKLEPNLGLRGTLYRPYNEPVNERDEWKSRETFETGVEASTEFYRVFQGTEIPKVSSLFNVAKWMHTIEPKVSYLYKPRIDQDDLPFFDDVDRIPYTNQVTYGISQRLVGKSLTESIESGPFEYARFEILQSYSLGDPFERDSQGRGRYFSNIQAELWWNFNPFVSVRGDAGYNPYRGDFDVLNAYLLVKDRRNDALQIQYRYTKDSVQEINLDTRVKVAAPLYFFGGIRYNVLEKTRVESVYGGEYMGQCWTFGLILEDKNRSPDRSQEKELKFQFYFQLLGIGSVGHKSSYMGF